MVTAKYLNKRIENDATLPVLAECPFGESWVIEWLEINTGQTLYPGSAVKLVSGSGGENKITATAAGDPELFGWVEFDPRQIANCNTAYAAGDIVPVIRYSRARGCILRNVLLSDPNAAVNAGDNLIAGAGKMAVLTEPTLTNSSPYGFAGDTLGTNGANGNVIADRVFGRNAYYIADPGADTTIVMEVL